MVAPIQTGDGSQPASASTFRPRGFAPTPTPTMTTNVTAPLDVRAGPSQASILAQQLQNSLQAMHWPMMEAERAEGMVKAKQSYEQGTADAQAGNVDEATTATDANYRAGAVRITAQKHAIQAVQAWGQYATDPQNGVAKLDPQSLVDAQDKFFAQRLGGLERDPIASAAIAPIVQHAMNQTAGLAIRQRAQQTFQDGVSNASALALGQAQHGGNFFDYQKQLDTLTAVAAGNRMYAKGQLDQALIQTAEANRNPAILDMITPAPGQNAMAPRTALAISDARQSITRLNQQAQAQYTQAHSFGVLSGYDSSFARKIPVPLSRIQADITAHNISPEQGLSAWQKSLALTDKLNRQTDASRILATGTPWYTQVGTQQPDGKRLTQADFENAATDGINQLQPAQRVTAAVQMTQQHGLVYEPLRATVNNEPLNTPQGVGDVLNAYNGIRSIDQSVLPQYFNDPKRLADVHFLANLQSSGMSAQDIAAYVQKHGFDANNAGAIGAKVAKLGQSLNQWTTSGKIGGTSLSDYANAGQINSRVTVEAHQIAESGLYTDPDQILTQAQRQVLNSSYAIKLSSGDSLLVWT